MMPAFVLYTILRGLLMLRATGRSRCRYYCYGALVALMMGVSSCQPSGSGPKAALSDSIAPYHLPAPRPLPAFETERIRIACERWYDTVLKQSGFNGGMIVAKNGHIVFERYHGTLHLPGTDTIDANTSMHIASTSKTFTAMAVLKLWQDGKLSLDDEFSKYFPQFNYPGVTVRTLLNHRSGLPNYLYFMENLGWDQRRFVTNEDVLNYLVTRKAELENIAPPDTHFSYSNTNFALLALLIEKISGKKYPQFLKYTFFDPLQMRNSFVYSLADTGKMKPSYDWKGRPMTINFLDAVYGDKNLYTTPRDLLTWDRALSSGLIFKPETLEQAYTPYSNEKPGTRNYGLGWRLNIYPDGKKIIYHNGWWHGSNACFIRLLQDSATIILIGNKFTRAIYHAKILANIFDIYYNNEEEDETENQKLIDTTMVNSPTTILLPGSQTLIKDSVPMKRISKSHTPPPPSTKRKKTG